MRMSVTHLFVVGDDFRLQSRPPARRLEEHETVSAGLDQPWVHRTLHVLSTSLELEDVLVQLDIQVVRQDSNVVVPAVDPRFTVNGVRSQRGLRTRATRATRCGGERTIAPEV